MADANLNTTRAALFAFETTSFPKGTFTVIEMEGHEALGRPFRFTLRLRAPHAKLTDATKLANVVNETATLTIFGSAQSDDGEVPYHGTLESFEERLKTADWAYFTAVLVPRFANTALDRISDIYLKKQTIDKTLEDVLAARLTSPLKAGSKDFRFSLKEKTYPDLGSIYQHAESTFDFVSRWLEKEGLYYYFHHSDPADYPESGGPLTPDDDKDARDKMVIVDDTSRLPQRVITLSYRPQGDALSADFQSAVQTFTCRRARLPGQVVLQSFNPSAAHLPLRQTFPVPGAVPTAGTVMIYGEAFQDSDKDGKRYARVRAEEIGCTGTRYLGEGTAVGMRTGYQISLKGSPLHSDPQTPPKFLVVEIEHRGAQSDLSPPDEEFPNAVRDGTPFYRNSFVALENTVQFRPARITPKPNIAGAMSAVVDSQGSIADLDDAGRYRITMPFLSKDEQDGKTADKIAPGIRMATPYAGSDHGMDFPLHKGSEVLLTFINGDPDQPVIMNAVPNSANEAVVNNEDPLVNKIYSKGGNSVVLDDKTTNSQVRINTPNLRGAVAVGGMQGNLFYSGSKSETIGAMSTYHYSGPFGGVDVAQTSRAMISFMGDFTTRKKILKHTTAMETNWMEKDGQLRTVAPTQLNHGDTSKITMSKGLYVSAGYDDKDPKVVAQLASIKTWETWVERYILAFRVLKMVPGAVASTRAMINGNFAESLIPIEGGFRDAMSSDYFGAKTSRSFDVEAYQVAGYTSKGATLGATVIGALVDYVHDKYKELKGVSRLEVDEAGARMDHRLNTPASSKRTIISLHPKGIKLSQLHDDYKANAEDEVMLDMHAKDGVILSTSNKLRAPTDFSAARLANGDDAVSTTAQVLETHFGALRLHNSGEAVLSASKLAGIHAPGITLLGGKDATIKLKDTGVEILSKKVEVGFTTPSPLPAQRTLLEEMQLALSTLKLQSDTADKEYRAIRNSPVPRPVDIEEGPHTAHAFAQADAMALTLAAERLEKIAAAEVKNATAKAMVLAKEAEIKVQTTVVAALPETPIVHGMTVTDKSVTVRMGTAGMEIGPTKVSLALAGSGVHFDPGGVSVNADGLIKLG